MEVAVTYFETMFRRFCGGTEGNNLNWDRCCYGWLSVLHICHYSGFTVHNMRMTFIMSNEYTTGMNGLK
jgi:hypothetical protein